jgi:[ribosomal protein S18]-alanine N-acetyltransferase
MRTMTLADVDEVLRIEQAVQAYPWTRGNFIDALSHGDVCRVDSEELVAGHPEQGGEIRGYAILRPLLDEAELLNIGVAAGHQRKGRGRAMLLEMLDVACENNILRVFLEVRPSNAAAIALYRSAGFTGIGVRRDYYKNASSCEDAITMACKLTGEIDG